MRPPVQHRHCEGLNDGFVRVDPEESVGLARSRRRMVISLSSVSTGSVVSMVSATLEQGY